jgi:cardiolipin synthase
MLYTLPNLLTLSRILAVPAMTIAYWLPSPWNDYVGFGMFALAGVTDWADGYAARRFGQQSELGRFLDPVADKLLVAAAILMLVAANRIEGITLVAAVIIMCREILVAGLREFLAELRVKVPVSRLAKWKTTVQILALGFLLAGEVSPRWLDSHQIGVVGLWIAAIVTLYTGYDYMVTGLKHMTSDTRTTANDSEAPAQRRASQTGTHG